MSQPWKKVHEVFFEASLAEGNSLHHSRLMYGAVYAWGPRWDIVDGKPIRTRDPAKSPTENELHDLAEWIKVSDPSLDDISRFVDNRFSRAGPAPEKRVALVIGNSGYAHTRSLPNARHDAYAIAGFLKALGFQVAARHDASYEVLRTVVRDFGSTSAGADFAVVYYAGHGLEVAGENYLLPIDAKLATSSDLEYEAISLTSVLDVVRTRRKLNLLILDACRNNPLAEKMALRDGAKRSVQKGLARVEPKGDILIAFAANAGTVAQDGTGLNSPFVEALIGHLGKPGLDIRLALGGVRDAVMAATGNMQEPVIYGALGGQIISLAPPFQTASAAQPNAVLREQEAKAAWDAVKDGCSAADIKLFAGRYKDTFFGDLAARRLGEIDQRSICVERGEVAMDETLIRRVQSEFKRLGCFEGPVNGNWGAQSSAGFKLYVQHANLPQDLSVPNGDLLAGMLLAKGRVCPLACRSDEKVAGGKCIKTPRPDPTVNTAVTAPSPLAKPIPAPKVVAGDCGSVRSDIQHNKFLVLLRGSSEKPTEVWTGSTNLSTGGIHGQTNVGHWIRDDDVAASFAAYWNLLEPDPGSADGDSRQEANAKRRAYRDAVMALGPVPEKWEDIPQGVSTIFSPRSGSDVLDMYAAMLDEAESVACVTLAFGVNKGFKERLVDNTGKNHVTFLLLEKRDRPNPRAKDPFVPLSAKQNVYQAWGSYLHDPLYQWTRETSARALGLNQHVSYEHSKFMLKEPLGPDPIVITGSANFSEASTGANDENMVLVRGNERAADIYFTEFNRLFNHYYFRSVQEATLRNKPQEANAAADTRASLFLDPGDGWLSKYKPGSLRRKRVEIFTRMANAKVL